MDPEIEPIPPALEPPSTNASDSMCLGFPGEDPKSLIAASNGSLSGPGACVPAGPSSSFSRWYFFWPTGSHFSF